MTIEKPKETKKSPFLTAFQNWSIRLKRKEVVHPVYDEDGTAWRAMMDGNYIGRMREYDKRQDGV